MTAQAGRVRRARNPWFHAVVERAQPLAWIVLGGLTAYQFAASLTDDTPAEQRLLLGAQCVVAALLLARGLRIPPARGVRVSAEPTKQGGVIIDVGAVLVLAATTAVLLAMPSSRVHADATLQLAPYAIGCWLIFRWPSVPWSIVIGVSIAGSLAIARALPITGADEAVARRIVIVRTVEGAGAFVLAAVMLRRIATTVVRDQRDVSTSLAARAKVLARETFAHAARLGAALDVELEAVHGLRQQLSQLPYASCDGCKRIESALNRLDRDVDEWAGDELVEIGMVVRRVRRSRGRFGMSVDYSDQARLDGAIFVRHRDFEPVWSFIFEALVPEPDFIACTVLRDEANVELRFEGRFVSRQRVGPPVEALPLDNGRIQYTIRLPVVDPRARPAPPPRQPPTRRIFQGPRIGVYTPLVVVLLVGPLVDVPASLLQVAVVSDGVNLPIVTTATTLVALALWRLHTVTVWRRRTVAVDPNRLFAPGLTLRWLANAVSIVVIGCALGVGEYYFNGIGHPQPFARYLLCLVVLAVLSNRVWPVGVIAWSVAVLAFFLMAIAAGKADALATANGLRSVAWWPWWLTIAVAVGAVAKRSLREMEDITLELADADARRSVDTTLETLSEDAAGEATSWAAERLSEFVTEVRDAGRVGCVRCNAALAALDKSVPPGTEWRAFGRVESPLEWERRIHQFATVTTGQDGSVTSSLDTTTIRFDVNGAATDRLRNLVARYCEAHDGWVSWSPTPAATARREGIGIRSRMARAIEDG